MSLDVAIAADRMRLPVPRDLAVEAVRATLRTERVVSALLSVTFVSNASIAALNRRHLGHRGATDVIAFGFARASRSGPVIGDVYIAPDVARANAREHRVTVRHELLRLIVHGTLHVLGHDHPEGPERESTPMWSTQERIVRRVARRTRP